MPKKADVLKACEDMGVERLEELYQVLLSEALGVKILVGIDQKIRNATRLGQVKTVQTKNGHAVTCPHCKRAWYEAPGEVFEAYLKEPDLATARHLVEQLAGKAKTKTDDDADPIFNVQFPAGMETEPGKEDRALHLAAIDELPDG